MKTTQCASGLVGDSETRCAIDWELDALGFCKYHSPLAHQCRGLAVTKGRRCRVKWDLDEDLLCKHHTGQRVACHFILKSGDRCGREENVNRHGFCASHPARADDVLRDFALMAISKSKRSDQKGSKAANLKTEKKDAKTAAI